eukprot:8127268-Pyramimonas_sp.AAC.1
MPCMATCDTILRRLHPRAGLQQNATNPSHWIGIATFGLIWVAIGCALGHRRGGNDTKTTGPHLGPG